MSDSKIHIVLIEDEKQIRRFLSTALESEQIEVFENETAKQGLISCATRKPDLVIIDLGLPDMDGIEVIRDLRSWSEVPVIVLSARSNEVDKVAALDAGAEAQLHHQPPGQAFGGDELWPQFAGDSRGLQDHALDDDDALGEPELVPLRSA